MAVIVPPTPARQWLISHVSVIVCVWGGQADVNKLKSFFEEALSDEHFKAQLPTIMKVRCLQVGCSIYFHALVCKCAYRTVAFAEDAVTCPTAASIYTHRLTTSICRPSPWGRCTGRCACQTRVRTSGTRDGVNGTYTRHARARHRRGGSASNSVTRGGWW